MGQTPGPDGSSSSGPRGSVVRRLPAHTKLVALVAFVAVVVATPTPARLGGGAPAAGWWPFAAYAGLLVGVLAAAGVPWSRVARRALVEVPFLVFALAMPFVAAGERIPFGPLSVSTAGLAAGAAVLIKATLGVGAAILLAETTSARDLLLGLERLRLPGVLVAILSFMVRYLTVVTDDVRRLRIARESRGAAGGRGRHLAAVAGGAGTLFVRSYERGERVHLAMRARGYTGRMPSLADLGPTGPVPSVVGPAGPAAGRAPGMQAAGHAPTYRSVPLAAVLPLAAGLVLVASRVWS